MNLFSPAALRERVLEPLNASRAPAPADHRALGASGCGSSSTSGVGCVVPGLRSQPFVIGAAEGVHGLGRARGRLEHWRRLVAVELGRGRVLCLRKAVDRGYE